MTFVLLWVVTGALFPAVAQARGFNSDPTGGLLGIAILIYAIHWIASKILGERYASAMWMGLAYAWGFSIIPGLIFMPMTLFIKEKNILPALGWTALVWLVGCVIYAMVKEGASKDGANDQK